MYQRDLALGRMLRKRPRLAERALEAFLGLVMSVFDFDEFFSAPRVVLAPMAGVSDIVFRKLNREQGADLTYTEMVSAKGLSYANAKTHHLLDLDPSEDYVAVQIFGHDPETMAKQASQIENELQDKLAYIDINMGCPARKIVTKGDGSALMKSPKLAADIVNSVSHAIDHPTTVKFRRGYNVDDETCVEFAKRMEDAGASAIAIHGRYAMQMYTGKAEWGAIGRVCDAVSIPVIGNGDIASGSDALRMLKQTGCDAVMIGRWAEGNPWIFAEVKAAMEDKPYAAPSIEDRLNMARRHARLLQYLPGKPLARMRKHAMWYVSGLPGASIARGKFNTCETLADFEAVFDELSAYAIGLEEEYHGA